MNMNQVILQQNNSFEKKMDSINTTNNLLDQLQNKLNSFFQHKQQKPIERHLQSEQSNPINQNPQESQQKNPYDKNSFRMYGFTSHQNHQIEENIDIQQMPQFSEKLQKKNDQFKIFPKNSMKRTPPTQTKPKPTISHQLPHKKYAPEDIVYSQHQRDSSKGYSVNLQRDISSNVMVKQLESLQTLMSQKLKSKQSRIAQLQQEIMTENEERVYLYKVNVRLEEQLQMVKSLQNKDTQNVEWELQKYQREIQRLKQELNQRKKQKKQLKKEQNTLNEGYKTMLKNRREYMKKDIQLRMNNEMQAEESDKILKGLLTELDKLKGAVQSRIKTGSRKRLNYTKH